MRENGPSTETLITAAELMRERHAARKRGETVAVIEVPTAN